MVFRLTEVIQLLIYSLTSLDLVNIQKKNQPLLFNWVLMRKKVNSYSHKIKLVFLTLAFSNV